METSRYTMYRDTYGLPWLIRYKQAAPIERTLRSMTYLNGL